MLLIGYLSHIITYQVLCGACIHPSVVVFKLALNDVVPFSSKPGVPLVERVIDGPQNSVKRHRGDLRDVRMGGTEFVITLGYNDQASIVTEITKNTDALDGM